MKNENEIIQQKKDGLKGDTMQQVTPSKIHYSDGSVTESPVVQIWDALSTSRSGCYRAFWAASPEADSGSPVIGYCSPGGAQKTINAAAWEVWRLYPDAQIYRNGKPVKKI
jgi:hypothetical protein